ncbi:glycosyltransferase family 39 protein [Sphingomonas citri]
MGALPLVAIDPATMRRTVAARGGAALGRRVAVAVGAGTLLLGLFGRIMAYPLGHDEEGHVAAARLVFREPLYQTLGYNHFPGLPLVLGGLYELTGTVHLLLIGRLLVAACWIATAALLWIIARANVAAPRERLPAALFAGLALASGGLLDPAGMLVTNNFLPVPFALLGLHLLILGLRRERPAPAIIAAAGCSVALAVMMKVAFVFVLPCVGVAALLVRRETLSLAERLRTVVIPLVLGGLVGGTPLLVYLAREPEGLLAHTIRYFTGPHRAYWQQSTEPKVMTLAGKIMVADQVWLGAGGALALLLIALFVAAAWPKQRERGVPAWPLVLCGALALSGAALSFLPTPAFPQYYLPPLPFVAAAVILAYAAVPAAVRTAATAALWAGAAICLVLLAPRLLAGVPDSLRPASWAGVQVHADGERLRALTGGSAAPVATLAPILPLEGGLAIYPEFANGPFVYRLAPYLAPADRRWFTTAAPATLDAFLAARPPSAIVTGWETPFDPAFERYALAHGYRAEALATARAHAFIAPAEEK